MTSVVRVLAVLLLAGTVLLGIGAAVHPVLAGDASAQLRLIADTPSWRTIHLLMLAGSALVAAGVWVRLVAAPQVSSPAMVAALALISLGVTINALNIAYMTGAGWHMADLFAAGRTDVVPIFEATHPIGLVAARFGNLIVAIGATVLGWAERSASSPVWLACLAWIAGIGGLAGVVFFDESSRLALAAVALLSAWQTVIAIRALAPARASGGSG